MADSDFWTSGSLPSEAELRDYLRAQGAAGEALDSVVEEYRRAILGSIVESAWSKDEVNDWVRAKITKAVPDNPVPDIAGPTSNASQIVQQRETQDEQLAASAASLADQRSEVLARQAQTYYDQASKVVDAGTAYGGTLATSIALGFRVDEYGNPLRDDMGNPIGVAPAELWSEIRGQKFNMGALAMPYDQAAARQRWYNAPSGGPYRRGSEELLAGASRSSRVTDDGEQRYSGRSPRELISGYEPPAVTSRRVLTPAQALAMLTSMDEDYLTRLQHEMHEAGLFERVAGEGAIPTWGKADVATRKAFIEMFTEASTNPNEPISQLLNRLANERIGRLQAPESGPGSEAQLPDFNPEVTSEATLGETIDEIAQNLRGEFASDEEKKGLIQKLQSKEIAAQRELYDRSIADMQAKGGGGEDIDRFMAALAGKESGGNYSAVNADSGASGKFQIMPENWSSWATRAGLSPQAPRTPGNQEIVARRIMLDYYQQFGNWRDVAVAWYSGPGRVASKRYDTRPQGGGKYPSISAYADDVMARFARQGAPLPGELPSGDINSAIPRFDPAAEARAILKAQDPEGWQAHEYADRAIEFYSLLGGVV